MVQHNALMRISCLLNLSDGQQISFSAGLVPRWLQTNLFGNMHYYDIEIPSFNIRVVRQTNCISPSRQGARDSTLYPALFLSASRPDVVPLRPGTVPLRLTATGASRVASSALVLFIFVPVNRREQLYFAKPG
ncbi:hypothetical protein KSP40_PGU008781 [Platanthera guangdongensis]|uniref:Uncharacterized protein n=1 Tax=Platanthera guangdongensis TaxID=2320717 RepID=A0ABR2N0G4_9ASPA